MKETHRVRLLEIDSVANFVLGVALLAMPRATIAFFGLPTTNEIFYVSILGAVLLGIGVALWAERKSERQYRGLGLFGALVINLIAGSTVCVWLTINPFDLPMRGYLVLWTVAVVVIGIGLIELLELIRGQAD